MLADKPSFRISIAGMLMIDSPYHFARCRITQPLAETDHGDVPDKIIRSFANTDAMLNEWDLPSWKGPSFMQGNKVTARFKGLSFDLGQGTTLYKPLRGSWRIVDYKSYARPNQADEGPSDATKGKGPPPGVMIRCVRESDKIFDSGDGPVLVDIFRHETFLGWEGQYPDFLVAMMDFDSHHYDVFDVSDFGKVSQPLFPALSTKPSNYSCLLTFWCLQTVALTNELLDGLEILDNLRITSIAT